MPPNILYIHSHDSGRELQPYNERVRTPALSRLAEEGVLFENAFAAAPTCSPSRAALLTGMFPHEVGMQGLAHRGFALEDPSRHLAHRLRRAGYHTALSGIQHVEHWDPGVHSPDHYASTLGYDAVLNREEIGRTGAGDAAADRRAGEFLRRYESERPFFLSVGFFETHRPFGDASHPSHPETEPPGDFPDHPEARRDWRAYCRSAACLDERVDLVLRALTESGRRDDTLVIFTTDHGIAFPRRKATLYDGGTGVALLLRLPGFAEGGRRLSALVSHLDLHPTLLELAGAAVSHDGRGTSLAPLLDGSREEIHERLFTEHGYHCNYDPARAVRTRRWKYIRRHHTGQSQPRLNIDDGPSASLADGGEWPLEPYDREELYDVHADPWEKTNLIGEPFARDAAAEMRAALDEHLHTVDDPLLSGDAYCPGAVVNPYDSLDRNELITLRSPDDLEAVKPQRLGGPNSC